MLSERVNKRERLHAFFRHSIAIFKALRHAAPILLVKASPNHLPFVNLKSHFEYSGAYPRRVFLSLSGNFRSRSLRAIFIPITSHRKVPNDAPTGSHARLLRRHGHWSDKALAFVSGGNRK